MRIKATTETLLNALEQIVLATPDSELIAGAARDEIRELARVFARAAARRGQDRGRWQQCLAVRRRLLK